MDIHDHDPHEEDFFEDDASELVRSLGIEEIDEEAMAEVVGALVPAIKGLFLPAEILADLDKTLPKEAVLERTTESGEVYKTVPAQVMKYIAARIFRDRLNTRTVSLEVVEREDYEQKSDNGLLAKGHRVVVCAHVEVKVLGEGGMSQIHTAHGVGCGEALSGGGMHYKARAYRVAVKSAETDAFLTALERYGPGLIKSRDARALISHIKHAQIQRQREKERARARGAGSAGQAAFSGNPQIAVPGRGRMKLPAQAQIAAPTQPSVTDASKVAPKAIAAKPTVAKPADPRSEGARKPSPVETKSEPRETARTGDDRPAAMRLDDEVPSFEGPVPVTLKAGGKSRAPVETPPQDASGEGRDAVVAVEASADAPISPSGEPSAESVADETPTRDPSGESVASSTETTGSGDTIASESAEAPNGPPPLDAPLPDTLEPTGASLAQEDASALEAAYLETQASEDVVEQKEIFDLAILYARIEAASDIEALVSERERWEVEIDALGDDEREKINKAIRGRMKTFLAATA